MLGNANGTCPQKDIYAGGQLGSAAVNATPEGKGSGGRVPSFIHPLSISFTLRSSPLNKKIHAVRSNQALASLARRGEIFENALFKELSSGGCGVNRTLGPSIYDVRKILGFFDPPLLNPGTEIRT